MNDGRAQKSDGKKRYYTRSLAELSSLNSRTPPLFFEARLFFTFPKWCRALHFPL